VALDKDITIIHILRFGVAYCKRPGLPYEWPVGHGWIAYNKRPTDEEKPKVCAQCKAAKMRANQQGASS
jgi:hypothetical protein